MWRSQHVNVNISWNFGNMVAQKKKKKGREELEDNGFGGEELGIRNEE